MIFRKNIETKGLEFIGGEVIVSKWVTIEEFETMYTIRKIIPTVNFTK